MNAAQSYSAKHEQVSYNVVIPPKSGPVAQRLEQWTHNPLVQGSNPCGPTKFFLRWMLIVARMGAGPNSEKPHMRSLARQVGRV